MKAKLAKLSPREHEALLLARENVEGGDPYMGHVSWKTCARLIKRGLMRSTIGPAREGYARSVVPTEAGLGWLEAMAYGPGRA